MVPTGHRVLNPLERWSAILFVIAGGLAIISSGVNTLDALPGVSTQHGLLLFVEGIAGFGGVVLSFVAMLGLYPKLRTSSPGLARVGVGVMLLPVLYFLVDLVWLALSGVLGLPSLTFTYLPSPMLAIGAAFLLFAIGTTVFGVIALLTSALNRTIGGFLLLFGLAWFLLIGGIAVSGVPIPVWLLALTGAIQGGSLLAIGYLLRADGGFDPRAEAVTG